MKIFKIILILFYSAIILFIAITYFLSTNHKNNGTAILLVDKDYLPSLSKDIYEAKSSIICSIPMFKTDFRYEKQLDNPVTILVNSFIEKSKTDVNITLIIETSQAGKYLQKDNLRTAEKFANTDIKIYYDETKSRLNSKLCVIDNKIVYIGSHNFTYSAMARNKEASAKIISDDFAKDATKYLQSIILNSTATK